MFSSHYSGHSLWKNTWHRDHTGEKGLSQCQGIAMWHVSLFAEKTKDCVSMKGGWNMFRTLQTLNKMCEVVEIHVPEGSTIL